MLPDRSIHITVDDVSIGQKDITSLIHGYYLASKSHHLDIIKKNRSEMPVRSPYVYFTGKKNETGREIVWISGLTPPPEGDAKRLFDEQFEAVALAAIDAGDVAEPWKSLYGRTVRDENSRTAFGEQLSKVLEDASDQQKAVAAADVAWLRSHVITGMQRSDIYAALRSYGLTAYNYTYDPGTPFKAGTSIGCSPAEERDRLAAAWPYPGEPIPKPTGGCATPMQLEPEAFPSAGMSLPSGFSIACSSKISIVMKFGTGDRLRQLDISDPKFSCL